MATLRTTISPRHPARFRLSFVISLIAVMLAWTAVSLAQPLTLLHVFNQVPGDGYNPYAPVVMGQNGVLYGTTFYGGNYQACVVGCGEAYQLTPPAQPGGPWNYFPIYEFTGGRDGCCVDTALTLDNQGRLYGVTDEGIPYDNLFRLTSPTNTFWKYNDLYDFTNSIYPSTPLLIDSAGALYGVSLYGGPYGVVVQFVPNQNGPWTGNILYRFTGGTDGAYPAAIVLDSATGTLYGIASAGGMVAPNCPSGCGTAFQLAPAPGGTWTYSVLYSFKGVHDWNPYAGLVRDARGNLYGLASRSNYATEVFKLTRHQNGTWTDSLLHRFAAKDIPEDYCGYPPSFLTQGSDGALYGAIFGDIDLYFGALFQLTPPAGGKGSWAYTTTWDFNESGPDLNPNGVVQGPDGALYGTTNGGDSTGGTVFRLQLPSQAPWPPTDFCY